jgi:hypothetical protein
MKMMRDFFLVCCLFLMGTAAFSQTGAFKSGLILHNDTLCYIDVTYQPDQDENYLCGTYQLSGDTIYFKEYKGFKLVFDSISYSNGSGVASDSLRIDLKMTHFLIPNMVASFKTVQFIVNDVPYTFTSTAEKQYELYVSKQLSATICIQKPLDGQFRLRLEDGLRNFVSDEFMIDTGGQNTVLMSFTNITSHSYGEFTIDQLLPKKTTRQGKTWVVVNTDKPIRKKKSKI